jgi:hypothetical protein
MNRDEMIADAQAAKDAGDHELEMHIYQQLEKLDSMPVDSKSQEGVGQFLSGVGGKVLEAAGAVRDVLPPTPFDSPKNYAKEYAKQGLDNATGLSGSAGKFLGSVVPYAALPQAGALQTAVLTGAITPGNTKERLKQSAITGGIVAGVPIVGKALASGLKKVGFGLANVIGGVSTGTGGESLKEAARAGYQGGQALDDLVSNMRGNTQMDDVLQLARDNIRNLGAEKTAQYRSGMVDIKNDKSVLSFDKIDDALKQANDMVSFKGQVVNESANKYLAEIQDKIAKWKGLNPKEFHTPEGLDQLKQSIGAIQEKIPFEDKTSRKVAGNIYNAIKDNINVQAPTYAKVMRDYSSATKNLHEIEKSLSLGGKATDDTALRKLQSIMRNNVNTNYGNRLDSINALEQGGNELLPSLAGQSLSSWTPRGLGGLTASGTALTSLFNPSAAALLPLQSPRLMGELLAKGGQGTRIAENLAKKIPNKALMASILYQMNQQNGGQ